MSKSELESIVDYLVTKGLEAIEVSAAGIEAKLDYVAIFTKNEDEFNAMLECVKPLGSEVDTAMAKTGHTFKLTEPLQTNAGPLEFLKIRKPDPTRPQRGGPDFVVEDFPAFKERYLSSSGNFTLMVRRDYEMIELKGVDVLVYLKGEPFSRTVT